MGIESRQWVLHCMSIEKVNALRTPNTTKRLRSFLGMTNYYRKFISNYAMTALPLYSLLKKDVRFKWSEECQVAFNSLIQAINQNTVLALSNYDKQFHLTTDASNKGIGAVLSQGSLRKRKLAILQQNRNAWQKGRGKVHPKINFLLIFRFWKVLLRDSFVHDARSSCFPNSQAITATFSHNFNILSTV